MALRHAGWAWVEIVPRLTPASWKTSRVATWPSPGRCWARAVQRFDTTTFATQRSAPRRPQRAPPPPHAAQLVRPHTCCASVGCVVAGNGGPKRPRTNGQQTDRAHTPAFKLLAAVAAHTCLGVGSHTTDTDQRDPRHDAIPCIVPAKMDAAAHTTQCYAFVASALHGLSTADAVPSAQVPPSVDTRLRVARAAWAIRQTSP